MDLDPRRAIAGARMYHFVILLSSLWFMVQFLRFVFPPLFETFHSVFGVSNTETGLLFTLLMLAYAAIQFPAGILGDRLGLPIVIASGAVVFTGAALLVAMSPSFLLVTVAAMLIGLGTGPHKTVAIPLLSRRYPNHSGRVLGVMDTVGQFGGMTAPLVVVVVTGVFVWRSVFILGAAVTAVLVVLFLREIDWDLESRSDGSAQLYHDPDPSNTVTYRTTFVDRRLLAFALVTTCFTFAWNGLSSFLPLFLTTEKGLSTGVAGGLYSLLFVVSVSQTATGELSDRVGKLTVAFMLFVTMFIGIGLLLLTKSAIALGVATVVAGIAFHGFRPVRDSYLMDVIPEDVGGGTLGAVRTVMTGVGALAPVIVGLLSDTVGFIIAFIVIAAVIAAAALLTFALR